ncbi:CAP domain-containing protein [Streptomyces sp. NPDC093795]|uniref:CAP domain-containing protein n=1 Tax=Streptomyces sp. NPDC093795 TaxID=3366051 RepID=UPI003809694F
MGRHRRAGAAPAAEEYAAGTDRGHRGARRKRRGAPVRTGLLGASAAVAMGAVAVATGLLPGGDTFTVGSAGTTERPSQSRQAPELTTQGGATQTPTGDSASTGDGTGARTGSSTGTDRGKASAKPSTTPSTKPTPKATPTPTKPAAPKTPRATKPAQTAPATPRITVAPSTKAPAPKPDPTTEAPVEKTSTPSTSDRAEAAEAEVLRLVNVERAKVGCSAVSASAQLAALAGAYSSDMAARGFFDHTDPDGNTPWARAEKAGVSGLGGENIARGQADAAAVMESWMNSDGHRANILNCDFTTLGVGVHFGDGGPWWTQNFGY